MEEELNAYLLHTLPTEEPWMVELRKYASAYHVPIMEPISMNFLTQLVRMKQPKRMLEIGTAIGYSALRMANACSDTSITTIEKDEEMYEQAIKNINQFDKYEQIDIKHGDAIEVIQSLYKANHTYDFIFIDAAKGKYQQFFELVQPLVSDDVMIVCDNILFRGYVANPSNTDNKRLQKLAKKISNFNDWLMMQENYHSSIIPIGDGLTISIRKEQEIK